MKIDKELFNKLSKDKQKELKERAEKIRSIPLLYIYNIYIYWSIYLMGLLLLIIPLYKIAYGNKIVNSLIVLGTLLLKVLVICMVVGIVIDVSILIFKFYHLNKLKYDYFKIEVK